VLDGSCRLASGGSGGWPSPTALFLGPHLGTALALSRQDPGVPGIGVAPTQVGMHPGGERDVVAVVGVVQYEGTQWIEVALCPNIGLAHEL
jgi:hypothetical protein